MEPTAVTPVAPAPTDDFRAFAEEQNRKDLNRFRKDNGVKEQPQPKVEEQTSEEPADTVDASAASSDTAAGSEPAPPQETHQKTQATSESRWAKLSRENRELKERIARFEADQSVKREPQQTSQPAPEVKPEPKKADAVGKPKIDDVDEKGQPRFKTYDEYLDARDTWLRAETKREFEEGQKAAQREQEKRQAEEATTKEWKSRAAKAAEKYADFNEVALDPKLPIKQDSPVAEYIFESPNGTDVLYHLGKNPAELQRINTLSRIGQARELALIESKLSSPPVKRVTSAPPPPRTVNATSTASGDEVEQALKEDDFASYQAKANARDMARRRS